MIFLSTCLYVCPIKGKTVGAQRGGLEVVLMKEFEETREGKGGKIKISSRARSSYPKCFLGFFFFFPEISELRFPELSFPRVFPFVTRNRSLRTLTVIGGF